MAVLILETKNLIVAVALLASLACCRYVEAQTTATTKQSAPNAVIVDRKPPLPQVVTVVHRLNGIQVLELLLSSGKFAGVENLDEAFSTKREVHTNIIAGLALDDGETVVAWLPEADLEVEAWGPLTPQAGAPLRQPFSQPATATPRVMDLAASVADTPALMVIGRDGKSHRARYIGLDGITGLSFLKLAEKSAAMSASANEMEISLEQGMRLYYPEPVAQTPGLGSNTISVRIGEMNGRIIRLKRGVGGEINRLIVKSPKLSETNIGGIAINDSGRTLGIVSSVEGNEAVVLPPSVIRGAAQRVLARKASVPRPWLGVSGEPIAFSSVDQIVHKGWEPARAAALLEKQRGILLTAIVPDSPAARAALQPGDVIVSVNNNEVQTTDDFSLLLQAAGEAPVHFTFFRPNHAGPESVEVRLSGLRRQFIIAQRSTTPPAISAGPLISQGVDTVFLLPAAAAHFNSEGGLFVVFVEPQSAAFKAGLRRGDVIEAINGQATSKSSTKPLTGLKESSYTLNVTRNMQKLLLTVEPSLP